MKRVLGLDLGSGSIGWAVIEENTYKPSKNFSRMRMTSSMKSSSMPVV